MFDQLFHKDIIISYSNKLYVLEIILAKVFGQMFGQNHLQMLHHYKVIMGPRFSYDVRPNVRPQYGYPGSDMQT